MGTQLVLIPVYNEETTIREVLCELTRHYCGDILVVNDGSTDRSITSIRGCIESRPITVIDHEVNQGYGKSLIDGFNHAINKGYETVVTMDCDWQHQPQHVPEFFEKLGDLDVLSGSRYLTNFAENTDAPVERRAVNLTITEELNELTGYRLSDSFCGFKAYRVSSLKKLSLTEFGYGFPIEFWIQAFANKFKIEELAVARIYTGAVRSFGDILDDSERRLAYYRGIIERERTKWNI